MSRKVPQLQAESSTDDSNDDSNDIFAPKQTKKSQATKQAKVNQPRTKLSKGVPQELQNAWNMKKLQNPNIEGNSLQTVSWIITEVKNYNENVRHLVQENLEVLTGVKKPPKRIRASSSKLSEGQGDKEAKNKKKEEATRKK